MERFESFFVWVVNGNASVPTTLFFFLMTAILVLTTAALSILLLAAFVAYFPSVLLFIIGCATVYGAVCTHRDWKKKGK